MLVAVAVLVAPDGPAPSVRLVRDGIGVPVEVASIDQYGAEVDDLVAAILDGTPPRVDLAFSRGTIATLVALDRAARDAVAGASGPMDGDMR
jgi:hypothetical protein